MVGIFYDFYELKFGFQIWLYCCLLVVGLFYDMLFIFMLKNLNWWWIWGIVLVFCFVLQIVIGVVLVMYYMLYVDMVFVSVEYIMCDVNGGYMLCYLYVNGVLLFFFVVYIYIFCGFYYGLYKVLCEVMWIVGMLIYLLMMGMVFMGYVLFWGQMFFWGVIVIIGLFGVIFGIGELIQIWFLGGFVVDNVMLNCFFLLYYLLFFVIVGLVIVYIWVFYIIGNNNFIGVEVCCILKVEV